MKHTVKTVKDLLPTLSLAGNMNEKPAVRKSTKLSPRLLPRLNALLSTHSSLDSLMRVMNPDLQQYCAEHKDRAYFGTAPALEVLRHAYHDEAATMWLLPLVKAAGLFTHLPPSACHNAGNRRIWD